VQDSCPAIGEQVTGHLTCQIVTTSENGACEAACNDSAEACGACVQAACGAAIGALAKASCN